MKSKLGCCLCLLCLAATAFADTRKFTVLGGRTIKARVQDGMPLPAVKAGIRIEGAGFVLRAGMLIWAFNLASEKPLAKILVEEVSGKNAVALVDEPEPRLAYGRWKGEATPVAPSKGASPWLFEPGDTTKVFRFTILAGGKTAPVVIYQPAVYPEAMKKQLLRMIP